MTKFLEEHPGGEEVILEEITDAAKGSNVNRVGCNGGCFWIELLRDRLVMKSFLCNSCTQC